MLHLLGTSTVEEVPSWSIIMEIVALAPSSSLLNAYTFHSIMQLLHCKKSSVQKERLVCGVIQ